MNRYQVTAPSTDGREFVYRITAMDERDAVMRAYGTHGEALRRGELDSPLTPFWAVEEVEESFDGMFRTMFHVEDESPEVQARVFRFIREAECLGIQLTPLDFRVSTEGFLTLDGIDAVEWLEAFRSSGR